VEFVLDGLLLRPMRETDAESFARHANDREVWLNLRDGFPHPYPVEAARDFIEQCAAAEDDRVVFGIDLGGQVVGACGLWPQDDVNRRCAEIAYWLGRAFHGRGLATKAVGALTAHAFDALDLVRVQAAIFEWNAASARVLTKCGYVREGILRASIEKDGRIADSHLYAKVRDPEGPTR
jgi:RimJ/RimL family protein N-acetyltransferase